MEFKHAVITKNGRELLAKLLAGGTTTKFTKISLSSTVYQDSQLESLTALTNVKMTGEAKSFNNNNATVIVSCAFENSGLAVGFDVNTVGVYALDPNKGEILYSVSTALTKGYMPADTGVAKSGFDFKVFVEIGNATNVNLIVDPAAFASYNDLKALGLDIEKAFLSNLVYISQVDQRLLQSERLLNDLNGVSGNVTLNNSRSYPFNNSVVTVPIAKTRNNLEYSVDVDVLTETGGFAGDVIVHDKQLNGFKLKFTGSARSVNVRYKLTGGLYK